MQKDEQFFVIEFSIRAQYMDHRPIELSCSEIKLPALDVEDAIRKFKKFKGMAHVRIHSVTEFSHIKQRNEICAI